MSQPPSRARPLSEHTWDDTGSEFVLTLANAPTSPWAQSSRGRHLTAHLCDTSGLSRHSCRR